MIKNKIVLAVYCLLMTSALGGLALDKVPGHKLELEQEILLTDLQGVAIPAQIVKASVGKLVKIYRTDGFIYSGKVTEIEESEGVFKIYGDVLNVPGVKFGFGLAKGGHFAGAVLDKENDSVYVLEFSDAHKGFVLKRAYKYDKTTS
jgi:hypothetical protein